MTAIILSGLQRAGIGLLGSMMTEKLFSRVLARLAVSLLERLAKSTKTDVDDKIIAPMVEKLIEQY